MDVCHKTRCGGRARGEMLLPMVLSVSFYLGWPGKETGVCWAFCWSLGSSEAPITLLDQVQF